MPRAFVFDLDGTLLNTLEDIGNACNLALRSNGFPEHPLKAYEQMVGNGFLVLVMRALPEGEAEQMPRERFEAILREAKEAYAQHMCERTQPYPGLMEALKVLTQKDPLLCVLSNKPEPLTKALIAAYFPQIPFVRVLGGREDMPLKPDPTRLLTMLKELDCDPAQSLFIGDSNVDMMTAHASGMTAIGVAWGFRGATELLHHGAARLLNEPRELAELA